LKGPVYYERIKLRRRFQQGGEVGPDPYDPLAASAGIAPAGPTPVGSAALQGAIDWAAAPGRVVQGQQPQTPGQWSDLDEAIRQANAASEADWGAETALNMVGTPGGGGGLGSGIRAAATYGHELVDAGYIGKIARGGIDVPTVEHLDSVIEHIKTAEQTHAGIDSGTYKQIERLNRRIDEGGADADAAMAEKDKLLATLPPEEGEPDVPSIDSVRILRNEFSALEKQEYETQAEYADGVARVLKRYVSPLLDRDDLATAIFRKAFVEAQRHGLDTKSLSNDLLNRFLSDVRSPSDKQFMREEFAKLFQKKLGGMARGGAAPADDGEEWGSPEDWDAVENWWRGSQHPKPYYVQPQIKGRLPRGSFVLPDDVALQLGGGSPEAAGAVLHGLFGLRPYTGEGDPRVIDPDVVADIGHGSLAKGQKVLHRFVQMVRRQSREGVTLEHDGLQHEDGWHGWRVARR